MRAPVLVLALLAGAPSPAQDGPSPDFAKEIRPLLETYCFKCHGGSKPKGDLDLSAFRDEPSVFAKRKAWEEVARRVRDGEMPPEDRPQPRAEERERFLRWFERAAELHDRNAPRDPGRAGLRRLNRAEYNNSIRDLFGVDLRPAEDFPADDTAHGYDTIADVLAIPPLLVEKYFLAAERILDQLLLPEPADRRFEGTREAEVAFPASGRYVLRARASGAGGKLAIRLEGKTIREFAVEKPQAYEAPALVARGRRKLSVAIEGEVKLEALEVAGPLPVPGAREARKRLFFAQPGADLPRREAARRVVERFASRAFRRPAQAPEVERFLALFDRAGERPFEEALRLPLAAVLCSPRFLFRLEEERASGTPWRIGGFELASRLSYFLWSTMPDDRLLERAGEGRLHEPEVLEAEVRRMLADPKSKALVENFLYQWLQVDAFHFVNPDNRVFPEFEKDGRIRRGMQEELRRFVEGIAREDRSVLDLLDADYTYVNEALARWYGLAVDVKGDAVKKVPLPDRRRGGLLTMGAVLVMTSSPDRTSVTKRGKWILEKILGAPPPPPPPDAGELKKEDPKAAAPRTLRERMDRHRSDPRCASCHSRIDPLGFALENYDGVGRWRDLEAGKPVDASGTLPGGRAVNGAVELKDILLSRKDEFARFAAENMLVYALGRGVESADGPALRETVEGMKKDGYRFSSLVLGIARSYPFHHRKKGE